MDVISTPGLRIEDVFKRVRVSVMNETGKKQIPWQSSSLTGDFYFASRGSGAVVRPSQPVYTPPSSEPEQRTTNSLGMTFVYIAPGSFMMGSPSDEPQRDNDEQQRRVTLSKGFYMQTTEVTQGQWKSVMVYKTFKVFQKGSVLRSSNRVNRGGGWNSNARNCRSANRNRNSPGNRNNNLGFRLALSHLTRSWQMPTC
ncbi:MAG: SUMF1/EgtB/PvdO family nonheme iron enzyme [Desulfobacteraceae bacterium]|nr:SUMF1/EgtB/PvdO family nonheme iron enzyme [Desulfobacteraceae bacterium]